MTKYLKKIKPQRPSKSDIDRFCSNVISLYYFNGKIETLSPNKNYCWNWIGYKDSHGYGKFACFGLIFPAHRFAFKLKHPEKTFIGMIKHTCGNPSCVNPKHLYEKI